LFSGWYRECGIIPHTTDIDIAILASEYTSSIEKTFRNDDRMKLYWILGKVASIKGTESPDDSLELSVYMNDVKYDVFTLYDSGDSSWVGGMVVQTKTKLRWTYPKLKGLCSAELLGELFYVPCNSLEFITTDYGSTWFKVFHTSKYVWHKSGSNIKTVGKWTDKEWPYVYQLFN
uniref:Nucleotidyltransferase n=1 Tax=Soboliphyme baturini TaxID=241478 RepID=A0A183I901_9BILA